MPIVVVAYRDIALRRPNTKLVQIICVLDESTPSQHAADTTNYVNNGAANGWGKARPV